MAFDRVVSGRPGSGVLSPQPSGQFVLTESDRGGLEGGGDGVQAALPTGSGRGGLCGPFNGGRVDVEQVVQGALQGGAERCEWSASAGTAAW